MLRTNDVDVAEALHQAAEDVLAQARDKHAADLATYREGVRRTAAGGGRLPPDEAERLLDACRSLGIPPERLSVDVGFVLQHDEMRATIESIEARNIAKREPIPRLEAELEQARAEWAKVRDECEPRMKAASGRVEAARKAVDAAHRIRPESTDRHEREIHRIVDAAPHLFGPVEPDRLRRIVTPDRRSIFG